MGIVLDGPTIEKTNKSFMELHDSMELLEHKLHTNLSKEDWFKVYEERSDVIRKTHRLCCEFDDAVEEFTGSNIELSKDTLDMLFEAILLFDTDRYEDPFYAIYLIRNFIPYFEKDGDIERLIRIYNICGRKAALAASMNYPEYAKLSLQCFKKTLMKKGMYQNYSADIRKRIFIAYYYIICVLPKLDALTINESVEYLDLMYDFWNSNRVQSVDSENDEIKKIITETETKWLSNQDHIMKCNADTLMNFCEIARKVYNREIEEADGDVYKISVDTLLAYNRMLVYEERCQYSEAVEYLLAYYQIRSANEIDRNYMEFGVKSEYYFRITMPDALIFDWLKDKRVPKEIRKEATAKLIKSKNEFFESLPRDMFTPEVDKAWSDWSFDSLNYIDGYEAKEYALFHVIISRQVSTFFHSNMVAALADLFVSEILDKAPEIFVEISPKKSLESVLRDADSIRDYIHKCALLHDIGKNRISEVINKQYRRLTPEEQEIIKRHPSLGADSVDEDFDDFHDVILGHHKTYDGRGGYPEKYDATQSKVKIVLDLVAICDSLDAATDKCGRNYNEAKTFEEVMGELKAGKDTRYNGKLVSLIEDNPKFYKHLKKLLDQGRKDLYYNLFTQHYMYNK